ncbi:MAG: DinB family protein [Chloroflexota bacterium]
MIDFPLTQQDCPICQGTVDVPVDVVPALASMPERLAAALSAAKDRDAKGWSPRYVALHLADLEVSRGWRFRMILGEDNPLLAGLDQDGWADQLAYDTRDIDLALQVFAVNRAANVELLRQAGAPARARGYQHSQLGQLTFGTLVDHTAHHDLAHLRQIIG